MTNIEPTNNAGSDPDSDMRRTGASNNDPHGGHKENDEMRGPRPDPSEELVPAGSGALERSILGDVAPGTRHLAPGLEPEGHVQDGDALERLQPGFGPKQQSEPALKGNPDLGINPRDVRDDMPPLDTKTIVRD